MRVGQCAEVGATVSTKAGKHMDVDVVVQGDCGKDEGGLCACAPGEAAR